MNCPYCGAQYPDNAAFCPVCGGSLQAAPQYAQSQPYCPPPQETHPQQGQFPQQQQRVFPQQGPYPQQPQGAYPQQEQYPHQSQNAFPQQGPYSQQTQGVYSQQRMYPESLSQYYTPGFSVRANDPAILAAVKKNRKAAGIFGLIFVPLPFLGFVIYSAVSDKMEMKSALLYGGIISGVFLLFALFSLLHSRAGNTYDAVVTDKHTRERSDNRNSDYHRTYTEYVTIAKEDNGKKHKIIEREGSQIWAYNYLNVGDRFRYHPQFNFPYEHYDKSKAPYIVCVGCMTHNPTSADTCRKCNLPLLK